jgi:hypothetical protein
VLVRPELTEDTVIMVDGKTIGPTEINRGADGSAWIKASLGKHTLRILKPGFEPYTYESDVQPGEASMVAPDMERQWASVVVRGLAGCRVYLDNAPAGIVPSTGELALDRLTPGQTYDVRFELEDYVPLTKSVRVEAGAKAVVDAALEPLPTSGPFEDAFIAGLANWEAPATWKAAGGVLTVEGPGVGMGRDSRYRDLDMLFGLRLVDARGAAWVLRAKDAKNYYLFVLGGPKGRYPNQLRTYVVRDGAVDTESPDSVLPIVAPLEADETYRVRIQVRGNVIQQWLTPSSTGEEISVGLFADVKRAFSLGRVGFAAPFGESFQINGLSVRPVESNQPTRH